MSDTVNASSSFWSADLLSSFLAGDPNVREQLPAQMHPVLLRQACRVAPDLEHELHEDIVQRVWELMLQRGPSSFDLAIHNADKYVDFLVHTAATDVRAIYAPPGQRTRPYRNASGEMVWPKCARSLDDASPACQFEGAVTLGETIADPRNDHEACLDRLAAEELLDLVRKTAPEPVYEALCCIYREEFTLSEAAATVGLHRSTLRRRVDYWVSQRPNLKSS